MSNEKIPEGVNHSDLVIRLCKQLAGEDEELAAKLGTKALQILSASENYRTMTSTCDELYYLKEMKKFVNAKPKSDVEQFEMLCTTILNSSVITQKSSILCFLHNISKPVQEVASFSLNDKLEKLSVQKLPGSKSIPQHIPLSNSSVKHIFEKRGRRLNNNSSAIGINNPNSQTSISSIGVWSGHDAVSTATRPYSTAVSEQDLLLDVIYSFQGIQGKNFKKEPGSCGFILDPKATKNVSIIQRGLIERLLGMSFLHGKLKQFCENHEKQSGSISQAIVTTLNNELSEYYKAVALLEASMNRDNIERSQLTLRRALCMMQDHRVKFEWLAYIAEACEGKRGGAMISAIHGFLQHGSPRVQEIAEKVLKAMCKPLYIMLSRFLLDGEIIDPCNEFFIKSKAKVSAERLWHDKYKVNDSMVPSFFHMEHAKRILAIGKSITFLRRICKESEQLPGREELLKLFNSTSPEALFTPEQSIEFHSTLKTIYKETSLRVLDLLKNKFKLNEHLQSLRRYLLLGQGDFIRHLLELLMPELNKSAVEIQTFTLSAILESAVRVTNAQYEDEDILNRLNVSVMRHSAGDFGWDIFSLVYVVDGPIGTILQPTMPIYQGLFGALWKAKRIEYVLANMRRQQLAMRKLFNKIRELTPVMHIINILTSKMIHFIHQTQYYFLFEVLECSWADMQTKVFKAENLDDIIVAHSEFLSSIERGVLLDEDSRALFSHLISIYNLVLYLESHQQFLYDAASREFDAFTEYRRKAASTEGFELNDDAERAAKVRVEEFRQFLIAAKLKVKTTANTYENIVIKFLELLKSSSNVNLQLLSVRLNFNDFYKSA